MTSSVLYDAPGPRALLIDRILNVMFAVVLTAAAAWAVYSMYNKGLFDERWKVLWDPPKGQTASDVWYSLLIKGVGATLLAALLAAPIAFLLGGVLSIIRKSRRALVKVPAVVVTEGLRGLPVLLMMFLAKLGFGWSPLQSVVFGLAVYNLAVVAEILRAGLASLPSGQREAGLSLGLSSLRTILLIEMPQAVRTMMPSLVSQLVVLLKDSSLGFIVGYADLLRTIKLNRDYFGGDYLFPLFFVGAAIYILINFSMTRVATALERRIRERPNTGGVPPEIGPMGPIPQSNIGGPARGEGARAGDPVFGHRPGGKKK